MGMGFSSSCSLNINKIAGNGNVTISERMVKEFDNILIAGVANVNIHFTENYRVTVTTDSNIQDIVITKIDNKILRIDEKHTGGISPTKLIVDVYMPKIEKINLTGVGNINLDEGTSQDIEVLNSGIGNIDTQKYQVKNVNVTLTGVGNIKIWAINTLSGRLTGIGNIYYKGNPVINIDNDGLGKVKSMLKYELPRSRAPGYP
jgi:hypothetical protein